MKLQQKNLEMPHWNGADISKLTKEELYFRVYHDEITGFNNWNYMWQKLDRRNHPQDFKYCFVHFDIKGTKFLNITYGHDDKGDA